MSMPTESKTQDIVIYVREHLAMGGIEAYVYKQVKELKRKGTRIIWVKHPHALLDSSFEEVFLDETTMRWNRKIDRGALEKLASKGECRISIITFDIYSFAMAEKFKRSFRACPIHTFYFVPHFAGDTLYLEEAYENEKRESTRRKMAPIIRKMHENDNIYYFSHKHIEKMTASSAPPLIK